MNHFHEPWLVTWSVPRVEFTHDEVRVQIRNARGDVVADKDSLAQESLLARIVACVNACAGIPTEQLQILPEAIELETA